MYKTKIHPNIFRYISTYILSCRIKKKKEINISGEGGHEKPIQREDSLQRELGQFKDLRGVEVIKKDKVVILRERLKT